jgi:hypothetical protein
MTTAKEPPSPVVPPPCLPENAQHEAPSKESTNNFNRSRCQFTYSDGRRCGNERAPLCLHHRSPQREPRTKWASDPPVETPELAALCGDLTTAANINRALAQTFLLMAQGRISQKQAVAFGYIAQLLLQTVPAIRSEFVTAYGQFPWKERLKASLECADDNWEYDDDPGRSNEDGEHPIDKIVEPKKGVVITPFFRHEKVIPSESAKGGERGISPTLPAPVATSAAPAPLKEVHLSNVVTLVPTIRPGSSSRATIRSEEPAPVAASSQTSSPPTGKAYRQIHDTPYGRGHTTQWFAPAAWSGRSRPDPYPSRYERLKREFRSLSNGAFRRLHHQNSRGFWSSELKHVTT